MKTFVKYTSFVSNVIKDIEKKDAKLRLEAARHVRKVIRKKISKKFRSRAGDPPGLVSGNLRKGLKAAPGGKYHALVGFVRPAYHAHLLEFGTQKMAARPVLLPTLEEEKNNIIEILTKPRV